MKFIKKYFNPMWMIFLWVVVFGMPALLVKLNPMPREAELMHFHAKILRISERPPNLVVETASGEHRGLRFPTPLYFIFSGKTGFPGLSTEQEFRLTGCDAEIYGSNVRYLWPESFRVWRIDCAAAPVSYRQIAAEYISMNMDSKFVPWFGLLVMGLFSIITFVQARKQK
jgi:hypothetical protein